MNNFNDIVKNEIMYAINNNDINYIKNCKEDINCLIYFLNNYITPLMYSIIMNKMKIVIYLIGKGANLDYKSEYSGSTALSIACQQYNVEAVKELLKGGANRFIKNINGDTYLMLMCKQQNCENDSKGINIIKELLDNKYLINSNNFIDMVDIHGNTPLMWTCYYNNFNTFQLLLGGGANANILNNDMVGPLLYLCKYNNIKFIKLLMKYDIDVNCIDINKKTPLIISYENDNKEISKLLIKSGAKFNIGINDYNDYKLNLSEYITL